MYVLKRNLFVVYIWCFKYYNKGFFLFKNCKINLRFIYKDIDYRYVKNVYFLMKYCFVKNFYLF